MAKVVVQYLINGVGYAAQGKLTDAKKEFEKALALDPYDATEECSDS